jgi:predicted ATPase
MENYQNNTTLQDVDTIDISSTVEEKSPFQNGSVWLRADFHLHTKADKEFKFEGEESSFVSSYVAALSKAKINIGVIANHNKFDLDEFKALKRKARKQDVFLLPGVELSVGDGTNGIHTIIVFSDEWLPNREDYINQFLTVAFVGKTQIQRENENGRSSLGLIDTIEELEGYGKDFFLVFAHVECESGLWKGMDGGRLTEIGKTKPFRRRALAFQKVRTNDKRELVRSWLGDAYPAEVEGSDPKALDQIGRGKSCYLKIGDFNFEAIKYALLDYSNRLRPNPQNYTHSHIRSISFEGGVLDGKTIDLSPELNTLIGIRGSGKSSILEAIRYALDIPFGSKTQDTKYKNDLVDHALGSGGRIKLRAVDQRGERYEIRRIYKETPDVYVGGILQPGVSIRETVLNKPIYFGQKDLSSTGDGFEKDLVEKLVGNKATDIRRRIDVQRDRVIDVVVRLKKLSNAEDSKKDTEARKRDAEFKLKFYRDHGIEEQLKKQTSFDADANKLKRTTDFIQVYLTELKSFIDNYEDDLRNQTVYSSAQNQLFFEDFFRSYTKFIESFERIKLAFSLGSETLAELQQKERGFGEIKKSLKEQFAQTERELTERLKESGASAIRPDEFRNLKAIIDQTEYALRELEKAEANRLLLNNELLKELAALNELWREEFQTIKNELDAVNKNHSSLTIEAEFKGDKAAFSTFMKDTFRGSRIRETFFQNLADKFTDFTDIYKNLAAVASEVGETSQQAFNSFFGDNLEALLTWRVPDRFIIKYRDKELKHHSLGQRASALILFVLNQRENEVFLIDQPEDDLDNQTIYEDVVKLVRQLKPQTQFIFATHNANFPVLGDAEQVIACSYLDGKIKTESGAIDSPALQQKVVDIMEGGKEAFKQRKRIYETWKSQNS